MSHKTDSLTLETAKEALILRLRLEAERIGMSEVARRAGVENSNLYKILADDANPTLESVLKVALALGFKVDLRQSSPSPKPSKSDAPESELNET